MTSKPHRATDKRRAGLSDNVKVKAGSESTGAGDPLIGLYNARNKKAHKNGSGKRAR